MWTRVLLRVASTQPQRFVGLERVFHLAIEIEVVLGGLRQRRRRLERLRAATDTHSSGRYRVNGVLSNMPEFHPAFSCTPDAPMVRATACRVW